MSIVVTAATGNIGQALTKILVESGQDVTVIARHPEKLDDAVRSKVRVEEGDMHDRDFVVRATAGADALFWLTPPNIKADDPAAYYQHSGEVATEAIEKNKIGHVVFISSFGAQDPDAGLISNAGKVEKALAAAAPNAVFLRCGSFMENFLMQLQSIKQQGSIMSVTSPTTLIPMVATRDIAAVAAEKLTHRTWSGHHIQGVQGPEDLSFGDAARILTEVLGKQIQFVQISKQQISDYMMTVGATPAVAKAYGQMMAALDHPGFCAEPRTPETTTPTTLREWATEVLKPAVG